MGTLRALVVLALFVGLGALAGCGKKDPPVYEVKGKVTLGGKAYPRLLVYFRPVSGDSTGFNNAVGETDKDGTLTVRSTGGLGLQTGEYKVTFTCQVPKANTAAAAKLAASDKPDEAGVTMTELVPASHAETKANDTTPVRFTVTSGANEFNFDVPAK
jgi:hypothetical protein